MFPFSEGPLHPALLCGSEERLLKLFILRAVFELGGKKKLLGDHGFNHDALASFLGLGKLVEHYDRVWVEKVLRKQYDAAEQSEGEAWQLGPVAAGNLQALQELVGLNETECRLLVFFALMHTEYTLGYVCSHWLDDLSLKASFVALAALLKLRKEEVAAALSPRGRLLRCGLLSVESGNCHSLQTRFDLLSPHFADRLLLESSSADSFLAGAVKTGKMPTLAAEDYRHIERQYRLLQQYLAQVLQERRAGVNILLHGAPGTGKSELVRLLAGELQSGLLEVNAEDEDGRSMLGKHRLRAFKAAQHFFSVKRHLILFDEIQDVFDDGGLFGASTAQVRKAEINTLLEDNPLPTFWLTNNVSSMDNAFIRRFDMVVELAVPPMSRRQEILTQALDGLPVSPAVIRGFSRHERLSPAVVQRAAGVIRAVQRSLPDAELPLALETLLNGTLVAQGHGCIEKAAANALPDFYDPALANADIDLTQLAAGIAANPSARICLYGPPGTGKSAFAQWLAQSLQRPFHNRKLSDILSMWVGGTEQNLQRVFREAEQDNAVLLLDEVDSFLQDRRQAQRSWELTQVNEMLVQMEAFNGVFIASTNLMDNLDQAALRRFDLKIRLGYLRPGQAWQLFLEQCRCLGLAVDADLRGQVETMTMLTPGDFAALQRRHRFHPLQDAQALLQGLRDECAVKEGGKKQRIGFV